MMLRRKEVFFRVYATDGPAQTTLEVPVHLMMSSRQIMELAVSPRQNRSLCAILRGTGGKDQNAQCRNPSCCSYIAERSQTASTG